MKAIMSVEVDRLNDLSYDEMRAWLQEALEGRQPVPKLSPDELPYAGILRLEGALDKPTRRDLARACTELVHGFVRSGEGDVDFVTSLLRLTVGLGLDSAAGPLARMAEAFPTLFKVPGAVKALVLATLVDLKVPQPIEFWRAILDQDRKAFAGTAMAGLLARNPASAIDTVTTLPDDQNIADAISIVLEQTIDRLGPAERGEIYAHVRRAFSDWSPLMRASIQEWLEERGEWIRTQPVEIGAPSEHDLEEAVPQSGIRPVHSAAIQAENANGMLAGLRRIQRRKAA